MYWLGTKTKLRKFSSYINTRHTRRNTIDSVKYLCVSKLNHTNYIRALLISEASLISLLTSCLKAALLQKPTRQAGWYLNYCEITSPALNCASNSLSWRGAAQSCNLWSSFVIIASLKSDIGECHTQKYWNTSTCWVIWAAYSSPEEFGGLFYDCWGNLRLFLKDELFSTFWNNKLIQFKYQYNTIALRKKEISIQNSTTNNKIQNKQISDRCIFLLLPITAPY